MEKIIKLIDLNKVYDTYCILMCKEKCNPREMFKNCWYRNNKGGCRDLKEFKEELLK